MVQARAVIGIADIHAGPFAHCIKALQDLDRIGAIVIVLGCVGCHAKHIAGCAANPKRYARVPATVRSRPPSRLPNRSEERRAGKESVSTRRSRWSPEHKKKEYRGRSKYTEGE